MAVMAGGLLTVVLLEVILAVSYRGFVALQLRRNLASLGERDAEIRILCVGESTTAVAADDRGTMLVPRTAYPAQLEDVLNERQSDVRYRVLNNGMMGGTTGTSLELLELTLPQLRPHVIVAMMGIKDTPDEWTPLSLPLPEWMQDLHTVKLAAWLAEDAELEANAAALDADSLQDLPTLARHRYRKSTNQVLELRIMDDRAALDRVHAAAYFLHIGHLAHAEEILRSVTETREVGYSLLAEVLFTQGNEDEAIDVLTQAVAAHPDGGLYRVRLARLLARRGDAEAAHQVLDAADADIASMLHPDLVQAFVHIERAELHLAAEQWDEALAELEQPPPLMTLAQAQAVPSASLLAASAAGRAHLGRGDLVAAEAFFKEALEISPKRHVNMWLLSEVYRRTGDAEKEEALRWSLIEKEGRVAEYFELAKLFRLTGHPERVPEVLDRAVEATPSLEKNYAELYDLARQHGARLVVMQYPGFALEPMHRYAPPDADVVFIDNEHVFDADPEGYFIEPTYPQSFTHYTKVGARVLAEHVADTVSALELDAIAD